MNSVRAFLRKRPEFPVFFILILIQLLFTFLPEGIYWSQYPGDAISVVKKGICSGYISFAILAVLYYICNVFFEKKTLRKKILQSCVFLLIQLAVLWIWTAGILSAYLNPDGEYYLFIGKAYVLYVMLPGIFGMLCGELAAFFRNRLAGMVFLIVTVYSFTTDFLVNIVRDTAGTDFFANDNFYYLFDMWKLSGGLYNIPDDYFYTASVGAAELERVLFWICLAFAVILFLQGIRGKRRNGLYGIVPAALAVVMIAGYLQPQSKYIVYNKCPFDSWNRDVTYSWYHLFYAQEYESFSVLSCELELCFGRQMDVTAKLTLDEKNLEKYVFTLYHGFEVREILNASGNKLAFDTNADTLTVYNDGGDCSSLTFVYSGGSMYYIANSQAVYLPEEFTYYPTAGGEGVIYRPEKTEYTVSVSSGPRLYSNLPEESENCFHGTAAGVTLYGGRCVKETQADGSRIIYSSLRWTEEEIRQKYLEMCALYGESGGLEGKDWFAVPYRCARYSELYLGENYFTGSITELENSVDTFGKGQ